MAQKQKALMKNEKQKSISSKETVWAKVREGNQGGRSETMGWGGGGFVNEDTFTQIKLIPLDMHTFSKYHQHVMTACLQVLHS